MTVTGALARMICRIYAVLPFVVTILFAGALAACPRPGIVALATVTVSFVVMCLAFREVAAGWARGVFNGLLFAGFVSLPALLIPHGHAYSIPAATALEVVINVAIIAAAPKLDAWSGGRLQLELFPDLLTSLVLVVLYWVPVRLVARPRRGAPPPPKAPYRVSVIVSSYNEETSIGQCIESLRLAVGRARQLPFVKTIRLVLADSMSTDETRAIASATGIDGVIDCPMGKINARHHAIVAEDCDLVVAADGDRAYDEDTLVHLLAPFANDERVIATTGETRLTGRPMSGSALVRRVLKMPFNGGNSAFFKTAYLAVPLNLGVDQFRHADLWCNEEFLFPLRLGTVGRVAYAPGCWSDELRPYPLLALLRRHLFSYRLRTF